METLYFLLHQCQASLADSGITLVEAGPVWPSVVATLCGAALGALLGGRYAYKSSVRAGRDLIKHNKLEEAYGELIETEGFPVSQMKQVIEMLESGRPHGAYELASRHELNLVGLRGMKAFTIIDLYFEKGSHNLASLKKAVNDFREGVQRLDPTSRANYENVGQHLRETLIVAQEAERQLISLLKEHLNQ